MNGFPEYIGGLNISEAFISALNLAISTSWMILAILLARIVFRNIMTKHMICGLWVLVGIKLTGAYRALKSPTSLIPSAETIPRNIGTMPRPEIHSGVEFLNSNINPVLSESFAPVPANSVNPLQAVFGILAWVWLIGILAMLLYALISRIRLGRRLKEAVPFSPVTRDFSASTSATSPVEMTKHLSATSPVEMTKHLSATSPVERTKHLSARPPDETKKILHSRGSEATEGSLNGQNSCEDEDLPKRAKKAPILVCDHIETAFVLGIFRPRIYLPSGMNEAETELVLAHERTHIAREDSLRKPLAFMLLSVYWFDPLAWLGYSFFCKDIEMACDERTVQKMNDKDRKAYSEALLSMSVRRQRIGVCPLAFAEVQTKERVRNIMKYKERGLAALVISGCLMIAMVFCFLADPESEAASLEGLNNISADISGGYPEFDGESGMAAEEGLPTDDGEPAQMYGPIKTLPGDGVTISQEYVPPEASSKFHPAIDISAAKGTPVYAAAGGTVTTMEKYMASASPEEYLGQDAKDLGKSVVILHNNGYATVYACLSEIAVKEGDEVVGGETVIGYVGSTGKSTGPHLHFELRENFRPLDPSELFK